MDTIRKALDLSYQTGNKLDTLRQLTNTGNSLWATKKYDEAIQSYRDALLLSQELGSKTEEAQR